MLHKQVLNKLPFGQHHHVQCFWTETLCSRSNITTWGPRLALRCAALELQKFERQEAHTVGRLLHPGANSTRLVCWRYWLLPCVQGDWPATWSLRSGHDPHRRLRPCILSSVCSQQCSDLSWHERPSHTSITGCVKQHGHGPICMCWQV